MNRRYNKGSFECLIVYGRRRVGKTALINEFCKDKPTVFFSALNASDKENLEALSKAIYEKDHPGTDSAPVFQSFEAALDQITRMAEKERLVFVIDRDKSADFRMAPDYTALHPVVDLIGCRLREMPAQFLRRGEAVGLVDIEAHKHFLSLPRFSDLFGKREQEILLKTPVQKGANFCDVSDR